MLHSKRVRKYMENININQILEEADALNKFVNKVKEARPGTYLLSDKDIKQAIILSKFNYIENITSKVISIDTIDNQYVIEIEEVKDNGINYL